MAAAVDEIPGYFVGRPLESPHYQEPQPQAVPSPPLPPAAVPAVEDPNAVTAQLPGYYYTPAKPQQPVAPAPAKPHEPVAPAPALQNSAAGAAAAAAVQGDRNRGFLARWFGGCFSGGGNGN